MLKIKDSVDLKELAKFGFELDCFRGIVSASRNGVGVNSADREFYKFKCVGVGHYVRASMKQKDIADLIRAGLVEKVK